MQEIQAKLVGSTKWIEFNFLSDLASGETIITPDVQAIVHSGTDPSPGNIFAGAPNAIGSIVSQKLTGGVVGTIYRLYCTVDTSRGQHLVKTGYLAVIAL